MKTNPSKIDSSKIDSSDNMPNDIWYAKLVTYVNHITHDVRKHVGALYMPSGMCTDMSGAIDLFKRIDPKVRRIDTFSGDQPDAFYIKSANGTWKAYNT
jgi:hypothetical protein